MGRFATMGSYWFFSFGIALTSFVMVSLATAFSFPLIMPHLAHYAIALKIPLYAHVIFGPLALLLAPFQFWAGLRTKRRMVHRTIGYTYVTSVVIAGLASLIMLSQFKGTLWAATGFAVLAILWITSTLCAVRLAQRRDLINHRRWMMRSAALTFAAVALRLEMLPLLAMGMTIVQTYNFTAWISWTLPLGYIEWRQRAKPIGGTGAVTSGS